MELYCEECGAALQGEAWTWDVGKYEQLLCPNCLDGRFEELSREERAALLGSRRITTEKNTG